MIKRKEPTLRDEMAALMPSLRWTELAGTAIGHIGQHVVARVYRRPPTYPGHPFGVQMFDRMLQCQSPRHAADTIRRKLLEFRAVIDAALEETT